MYSYIDPQTDELAMPFCNEAERLWLIERTQGRDSLPTIAAAEFLCLGYLGRGRDHAVIGYVTQASEMGIRMGLFGVENKRNAHQEPEEPPQTVDEGQSARMYAAWGVFNWIT